MSALGTLRRGTWEADVGDLNVCQVAGSWSGAGHFGWHPRGEGGGRPCNLDVYMAPVFANSRRRVPTVHSRPPRVAQLA
eukprot:7387514-Prymnesium_polylepis.1